MRCNIHSVPCMIIHIDAQWCTCKNSIKQMMEFFKIPYVLPSAPCMPWLTTKCTFIYTIRCILVLYHVEQYFLKYNAYNWSFVISRIINYNAPNVMNYIEQLQFFLKYCMFYLCTLGHWL